MLRTVAVAVNTAAALIAVVLLWLILLEQREQSRDLARLTNCVYVLQDSIGVTGVEPVRRCPIE